MIGDYQPHRRWVKKSHYTVLSRKMTNRAIPYTSDNFEGENLIIPLKKDYVRETYQRSYYTCYSDL